MSTVIAKNVQVGADGTPSNNFTIYQPSSPDGTMRIGSGNTGTASTLVSLTSAGVLNVPASITTATQAVKTANTTVATTAFVDVLRGLVPPTTSSSGGTLAVGDRGALVSVTAGVTVPANVFAANDVVTIFNNSASSITITQGVSLTMYQVGTANTGNRTLAQRGLVTIVFISATVAVISGGGLT